MDASTEIIVAAVSSGGILGASTSWWIARRKTPAEVDNLVVTGAEMTVTAALNVATAERARADRAEARVKHLEERVNTLEAQVQTLIAQLTPATPVTVNVTPPHEEV